MSDAGYLTIGKVVTKLQGQYPDLSVSKIRYLEDEGLLNPSRTPGGYRLYSPRDVKRLETVLYLQKTRFLPLAVIKEELERSEKNEAGGGDALGGGFPAPPVDDDETTNKFHDIEHMPDLVGASVSFVRQLVEVGVISLRRSPHGRDLVDGHDFALIRACLELRRFGIEPKNLRQYVISANRESAMFEQALVPFAKRQGETAEERRAAVATAFDRMLAQTNTVRASLLKRAVSRSIPLTED
jgi:DNA-binding transcriptional MerR regulator